MYRAKILRMLLLVLLLSFCFTASSIAGTVPQLINYQGTLTDTSGNPVPDNKRLNCRHRGNLALVVFSSALRINSSSLSGSPFQNFW